MAIPQQANAIFYHPLDDLTESLQAQVWTGVGESFDVGKVSDALAGGSASASAPGAYATGVGATRLAFMAWTRSFGPSVTTTTPPPTTPPPLAGPPAQFFDEKDRGLMMAMGIPVSELGGHT